MYFVINLLIPVTMKKDCYFYEAGVILLGSFQLCPLLLLLGSTIISVLLGVCWVLVLAWSTQVR